jgi:hypothetical protein
MRLLLAHGPFPEDSQNVRQRRNAGSASLRQRPGLYATSLAAPLLWNQGSAMV